MDINIEELVARTKKTRLLWYSNTAGVVVIGAGAAWLTEIHPFIVGICTGLMLLECERVIKMCNRNIELAENLLAHNIYTIEDTKPKP